MAANFLSDPLQEYTAPDGSLLYSPGALQGKRAYAAALMRDRRENRNAGDGLYNATNNIMAMMLMKEADDLDKAKATQMTALGKGQADALGNGPGALGVSQNYAPQPVPSGEGAKAWHAAIDANAKPEYRDYMKAMLRGEGGMNGEKSPTGAWGGPQWIESTGKQYGLVGPGFDHRNDPQKSISAWNSLIDNDRAALAKVLRRDPTWAETALAHQQGAGGASALLTNPDAPAGSVVNPRNLQVNRQDPNLPAGQVAQKIMSYYRVPEYTPAQQTPPGQTPPPYQVAQAGPSAQMPVQMAPGVFNYGGGTGTGITPAHVDWAKRVLSNPTVASPEMLTQANEIYKKSMFPDQWQSIGNDRYRTAEGHIVRNAPGPQIIDGKAWVVDENNNLKPAQVQQAGGGVGGGVGGIGGTRSDNQLGLSDQQKEMLKFYSGEREKHIKGLPEAANERVKLGSIQQALQNVSLRGPLAETIQPTLEMLASMGFKTEQAVKGQEAQALRATMGNVVGEMYSRGAITEGEREAAMKTIAGIGSFKGTEQALMDILYNANHRRSTLGMLSSAYNQGKLNDGQFIRFHDAIANDSNARKNITWDDQTGDVFYRDPYSGKKEVMLQGYLKQGGR